MVSAVPLLQPQGHAHAGSKASMVLLLHMLRLWPQTPLAFIFKTAVSPLETKHRLTTSVVGGGESIVLRLTQ